MNRNLLFLGKILLHPRSQDEDDARRELIVNIILLGSLLLLIVSDFLILYNSLIQGVEYHGISFTVFSLVALVFCGLYVLSRVGHWKIASHLLILFYLIGAGYGSYQWGPDLPAALLSFALVIVVSGILLGTAKGFLTALSAASIIGVLGSFEARGVAPSQLHWKQETFDATDGIEYAVILFLIMIVSWLANREIEKSLLRARRSESELRAQRDLLETIVEERTKKLRDAQMERMGQVYRFAEFGKLSSGFFHDLMTPLTVMSLHVQQLRSMGEKEVATAKNRLDNVLNAAQRMEHFIQAVRKQLDNHDVLESFSLNESIREVAEVLAYKSYKCGIKMHFQLDREIFHYGNPLKFHQILLNLLSNALDACVDSKNGNGVTVTLLEDKGMVRVVVTDTGPGIANDILGKIFDPFFTTKDIYRGMGIGLSLTKDIVEKSFGGRITVESTQSQGATFTVRFPLLNEPPASVYH